MHRGDSYTRWMTLVTIVLCIATGTYGQFLYPTSTSDTHFRVGDTVVVSWVTSDRSPKLELYGGYQEKRVSFRHLK